MAYQADIKDHIRETRLISERAALVLFITLLLVIATVGRLIYLQVFSHEHFTTLSHNNHVTIMPVPPTRGLIYDRNGVLLAQNAPTFSLEITPEQVDDLDSSLAGLRQFIDITPGDVERFRNHIDQKRPFEAIPLRYHLSEEEVARFAVNRHRFPGVDTEARLIREYPYDELGVHVLGYVGRINKQELRRVDPAEYRGTNHIGKTGIEKAYEELLHGTVGLEQVETNALGRKLRILERTPPVPGKDLYLTIDAKLQATAESALGGQRGSVVALAPKTGEVLAMASTPAFNPNQFVVGIDTQTFQQLQRSKDKPMFNRAIRGQYPPGSTLKPFIGLAGLDYNTITQRNTTFCPGWYKLEGDDRRYRDWKREGHGSTDLHKAIVQSCDVYFYSLAHALGIDRMHDFLAQFGFGRNTGIDITGELNGLLPSRAWKRKARHQPWFPGETLITGIGQGFTLVTPLQLATATAALANRGVYVEPYLLYAIQSDDGNEINVQDQPQNRHFVSVADNSVWDTIIDAMAGVVAEPRGTAHYSIGRGLPYEMAGKTGTAQVYELQEDEEGEVIDEEPENPRLRDHALFIAFAPVENPRIAVAVIVENGGSGATTAAPIAREIIDQYMSSKRI